MRRRAPRSWRSVDWRGSSSRLKSACRQAKDPAIVVNVVYDDSRVKTTQVYDLKAARDVVRESLRDTGVVQFGLSVYDRESTVVGRLATAMLFPVTHRKAVKSRASKHLGRTGTTASGPLSTT